MLGIDIAVAVIFLILGLTCLFLVALTLPGHWILFALAVTTELIDGLWLPDDQTKTFGWLALGLVLLLGVIGEVAEFMMGVFGAEKGGGTKRGQIGAFLGGLIGAFAGTAIPIPLVGSLLGALIGTFAGALIGEMTHPDRKKAPDSQIKKGSDAYKAALMATVGRIAGTATKTALSSVAVVILTVSPFLAGALTQTGG